MTRTKKLNPRDGAYCRFCKYSERHGKHYEERCYHYPTAPHLCRTINHGNNCQHYRPTQCRAVWRDKTFDLRRPYW